jgi:hypothetical protein
MGMLEPQVVHYELVFATHLEEGMQACRVFRNGAWHLAADDEVAITSRPGQWGSIKCGLLLYQRCQPTQQEGEASDVSF